MKLTALLLLGIFSFPIEGQVFSPNAVGYVNLDVGPGIRFVANPLESSDPRLSELIPQAPEGTILFKIDLTGASSSAPEELRPVLEMIPEEIAGPVSIALADGNILLEWKGELEAAPDLAAPFEAVSSISNPMTLSPDDAHRFFRARSRVAKPALTLNRYENGQWTDPEQRWEVGEGVVLLNPSEDGIRLTFTGGIPQGEIKTPIPRGLSLQGSKVPQSGGLTSDLRLAAGPGDQVFLWNGKSFSEFRSLPGGEWFPREPVLFVGQSFFIFAHEPLNWDREFAVNPVGATGN